jgi:hypothetical protein
LFRLYKRLIPEIHSINISANISPVKPALILLNFCKKSFGGKKSHKKQRIVMRPKGLKIYKEKFLNMKTLFLLMMILTVSAAGSGIVDNSNYSGTWRLDAKQSKNLPPYYENIKSHRLFITQDKKELNTTVEIKSSNDDQPFKINLLYKLDGTETNTETPIRTPQGSIMVPTILSAKQISDGQLKISIVRDVKMGEKLFKGVTVEDWQLSPDGRTLSIHMVSDTPRGKIEADLVFVKE